jgi:HipA-like protein
LSIININDYPARMKGVFQLKYGNLLIGILTYENSHWTFKYSEEFMENSGLSPITDFPDLNKVYESENLWPFFAARIPTLNQPYQFRKIKKEGISKDDPVGLLRLFGGETITNPFKLSAV